LCLGFQYVIGGNPGAIPDTVDMLCPVGELQAVERPRNPVRGARH
jgi:hypothetical protein